MSFLGLTAALCSKTKGLCFFLTINILHWHVESSTLSFHTFSCICSPHNVLQSPSNDSFQYSVRTGTYSTRRAQCFGLKECHLDLRNDVRQIIGASVSEPHTIVSRIGIFHIFSGVRRSVYSQRCNLTR